MAKPRTVVVKVGGSLFDLPDLGARLRAVFEALTDSRLLLIAGGGAVADVVRGWDETHALGDEAAHWLAIRAMSLGEELLSALLPEARVVSNRADADAQWNAGRIPILSAGVFLRNEEVSAETRLARSWNVTSDSIAAFIAELWPADELVLLKSVGVESAAAAVDEDFGKYAVNIPVVSWVNLRDKSPRMKTWLPRTR